MSKPSFLFHALFGEYLSTLEVRTVPCESADLGALQNRWLTISERFLMILDDVKLSVSYCTTSIQAGQVARIVQRPLDVLHLV